MAHSSDTGITNRLVAESSPYLRQHAHHPVDWYPWGEEALTRAREEDKPILLSIGYSACHWCHVMADESFADRETAEVMNALFVNIKVDREERPDLDRNYQLAHHILNQSGGGWPLTCFLDPNSHLPFFSGTYFPKRARYQLPSFVDLLRRVNDVYRNRSEDLGKQAEKLRSILDGLEPSLEANAKLPDGKTLARARTSLGNAYDATEGGFGDAPKFPMPAALERLLRHWAYSGRADNRESKGKRDRETLDMLMYTLTRMARGGIYDHLGGGFCRYSTDRKWVIPHFEKMLYDNGPLLALYADAVAVSRDALFEAVVGETAGWVIREMQHPEGGYYASIDADSEGHEGRFYAWRRGEVKALLDEDQYLVVETLYGLDKPANFESKWVLHRTDAWHSVIERLSLAPERANELLTSAKAALFAQREQRVRPGRDDKVITSWNGLMVRGMARAGAVLNDARILDSACAAADFLRTRLWQDGRLQSTWADGAAKYAGYLDDYAYLLDGLLTLLQTRWRDADLRFAIALADAALEHFEDRDNGGFFFTSHDHEQLIHRSKPTTDDAMPPGNGVLARALHLLGNLMGVPRYVEAAERTLRWTAGHIAQAPGGFCSMLTAAEDFVYPPQSVLVHGPSDALGPWCDAARVGYLPWRAVYAIPNDIATIPPPLLPPYLPRVVRAEDRSRPVAYVCTGTECSLPIRDLDALRTALA